MYFVKSKIGLVLTRLTGVLLRSMSPVTFEKMITEVISERTRRLTPKDSLTLLFKLDNRLYELQGEQAIAYGNGVHTKHRHMNYHDFFVKNIQAGEHVLDVGCGYGAVAYTLAQKAEVQITGIDINEKNIAKAIEYHNLPNIHYMVGDILEDITPLLKKQSFDVILMSNVLEHLPDRPQLLRHLKQTVQPKRFLIRVPLFERDWRVPLKQELGLEWRLDDTHEIEYTLETFTAEIAQAQLKITHLEVRWGEIWAVLAG
ncbi:MAG: class I SAM-dependent methyltransferase [Anaerolineae bacterium]|nr:class I SAM-dependent methyltransferase [Anaerolineae bacterium]